MKLSATKRFHDGKLAPEGEGELTMAITHKAGLVQINFSKSVAWLALDLPEARKLAMLLHLHADKA
jgi:hypothetical protein